MGPITYRSLVNFGSKESLFFFPFNPSFNDCVKHILFLAVSNVWKLFVSVN